MVRDKIHFCYNCGKRVKSIGDSPDGLYYCGLYPACKKKVNSDVR